MGEASARSGGGPVPLRSLEDDASDQALVRAVLEGDRGAAEALVLRHEGFVLNLARRMLLSPDDARDVAQDVLLKVLTRLSSYDPARGAFRTWMYRIVTNHVLNLKRRPLEEATGDFDRYAEGLAAVPDDPTGAGRLSDPHFSTLVEEAKVACLAGMLLCLDRDQRLAYVLGEVFEVPDRIAADVVGIEPAAFRKRLSRARADLVAFMNEQCGLVRPENPCRCHKKTRGFVEAGWVDPDTLRFHQPHLAKVRALAAARSAECDDRIDVEVQRLFRDHPFYEADGPRLVERIRTSTVLSDVFDVVPPGAPS